MDLFVKSIILWNIETPGIVAKKTIYNFERRNYAYN
jgi:hypothetical protein